MERWKNVQDLISYSEGGILSKIISKSPDATLFCMAAGTELSEHTSTRRGIVYIVEGSGMFILEGKKIEMKRGIMIFMREGAVHSLQAGEDTSFVLVLF